MPGQRKEKQDTDNENTDIIDRMSTLIDRLSAQTQSQTDRLANTINKFKDDLEQRLQQQEERLAHLGKEN
eukprot:2157459-Prorocentrum_lima.AAC.1